MPKLSEDLISKALKRGKKKATDGKGISGLFKKKSKPLNFWEQFYRNIIGDSGMYGTRSRQLWNKSYGGQPEQNINFVTAGIQNGTLKFPPDGTDARIKEKDIITGPGLDAGKKPDLMKIITIGGPILIGLIGILLAIFKPRKQK